MTIKEMQQQAIAIRERYNSLNLNDGHKKWSGKDYAMGFVGDFGDLMKLVMAKENMRTINGVDVKLKHELADCLWSLFVIADHYKIDLQQSFTATMLELDQRLKEAGV